MTRRTTTAGRSPHEVLTRAGAAPLPGGVEQRVLPGPGRVQVRAAGDDTSPGIDGYGAVYDRWTQIGRYYPFVERVAAGAGTKTIAEGDVRAMFNHDPNYLLGRTAAGTLRLTEDPTGLHYAIDIDPEDPQAMSVYRKVSRGDVTGSSFWFQVLREEWVEEPEASEHNPEGHPERTILEYRLFETGPVVFPAYDDTTADARALEARSVDALLRGLGVDDDTRRGELVRDAIADPDAFLAAHTDLLSRRAADEAPGTEGTPPPGGHLPLQRARHELAALLASS